MPRTFADYMEELIAKFPRIGPGEAETAIWRAIEDITDENELSFMIGDGKIVTEPLYKTGTVTTAGTSLTLAGGTWDPAWTDRRIKIKGRPEPYGITITGAAAGTLDATWEGTDGSGLTYTMFRDVYSVPSDCDYARELILWDTTHDVEVFFEDFTAFQQRRRSYESTTGTPECVTRGPIKADGTPQLIFGYEAPAAKIVYLLDYYRKPTKPSGLDQVLSPAWPRPFERIIWERAIWNYADEKGDRRRAEFAARYRDTRYRMIAKFAGGSEMRKRRITASKRSRGLLVRVNYAG